MQEKMKALLSFIMILAILRINPSVFANSLTVTTKDNEANSVPSMEKVINAHSINPVTLVFLKFGDNTDYSEINTAKMTSELLLTNLADCKYFSVIERLPDDESTAAEKRLTASNEVLHNVVEQKDYGFLFSMKDRSINSKKRGDFLVKEDTKIIGEKYGADYLLHGAIEYLGADVYTDEGLKHYTGLSRVTPYLAAIITVRLIRADTGEVVWARSLTGSAKENYYNYQGIGYGTKKLNSQLFFRAVSKACQETQKAIELDFEKGLIKL